MGGLSNQSSVCLPFLDALPPKVAPPDLSDAADRVSPDGVRRRPNDKRVPDPDDFVGDDCIDLTGDAFEPSD